MTIRLKDLNFTLQLLSRITGREDLHVERGSRLYGRQWKLVERNEFGGEGIILSASSSTELLSLLDAYRRGYMDAGRKE
jgi:hypothetical protein